MKRITILLLFLGACAQNENSKMLPAHPGESGKLTLRGIDRDRDGVRDDLQIFIAGRSSLSQKHKTDLLKYARHLQRVTVDPEVSLDRGDIDRIVKRKFCLRKKLGDLGHEVSLLEFYHANTRERSRRAFEVQRKLAQKLAGRRIVLDEDMICGDQR